jgi:RHS repeat-associated protein
VSVLFSLTEEKGDAFIFPWPTGNWDAVSRTSTGGGNTHSSYTGNGAYGFTYVGGGVSGTWTQNGGSDTSFTTQTSSTFDADAGVWNTTGGYTGGGDDNQNSTYSGSGPYDASVGEVNTTGGGSVSDSGGDTSSDNYSSGYTLDPAGNWDATSGNGTSNSSGFTHSSYSGLGGGTTPVSGGSVHNTWEVTEGGGTHYSMNTVSTLIADGEWTTTGTGDYGGGDALVYEYSDAGNSSSGSILDGGAGNYSDTYDIDFALTGYSGWQVVGGSAYAVESGYNDVFSPAPAGDTTYLDWAQSTLNSDGSWTTIFGPAGSAANPSGASSSSSDSSSSGGGGASSSSAGGGASSSAGGGELFISGNNASSSPSGASSSSASGETFVSGFTSWLVSGSSSASGSASGTAGAGFTGASGSSGNSYSFGSFPGFTSGTPGLSGSSSVPVSGTVTAPPSFTQTVTAPGVNNNLPSAPTSLQGAALVVHDASGNLSQVTDAAGNQTNFTYNNADQVTSQTDATGAVTNSTYDAQGNLTSQVDALGRRKDYTYNAAGQVLTETWTNADGSIADVYVYTYNQAGQLITASNHEGTYSYTYNAAGQVLTQTDPFGLTLTYGYDAAGNKTSVTDSLGGQTTSTYNANNQLTSRTYTGPEVSSSVSVGLNYNAAGQLTTLTRLSGATTVGQTSYSYDLAGDVTDIVSQDGSGNTLADYQYNYGQNSVGSAPVIGSSTLSASQISDLLFSETDNGVTTNYGYDSQDELTTAGATTETYDAAGNRTNAGYVTGADNRLLSDGTWNYSYDAVGNQVKKVNIATGETWTYGYDFNNRMTSAVDSQSDGGTVIQSVAYQYDVFGNRVEQDVTQGSATTVTRFAYDGKNAWADLDGNNNNALEMRHLYLAGADQPVAQISAAGAVAWYLTDKLGSVRDIVNNNGVVLDAINYDAFGNVTSETNPAQASRFGWAGGVRDMQTGLIFFDNRYYNPQTGRWTTKDPSSFRAGDANLYRYVGNDVTNATDPTGLFNWNAALYGGLGGATGGAIAGTFLFPPGGELVGALVGGVAGFIWAGIDQDGQQTDPLRAAIGSFLIGAAIPAACYLWEVYAEPAIVSAWTYATTHPEAEENIPNEGIYEFTASSGKTYVGQSGDIATRIDQHLETGKLLPGDLPSVNITERKRDSPVRRTFGVRKFGLGSYFRAEIGTEADYSATGCTTGGLAPRFPRSDATDRAICRAV